MRCSNDQAMFTVLLAIMHTSLKLHEVTSASTCNTPMLLIVVVIFVVVISTSLVVNVVVACAWRSNWPRPICFGQGNPCLSVNNQYYFHSLIGWSNRSFLYCQIEPEHNLKVAGWKGFWHSCLAIHQNKQSAFSKVSLFVWLTVNSWTRALSFCSASCNS